MKTIKLLSIAALLTFGFASCKKCVTCTYSDDIGASKMAESCNKKANEDLEEDLNTQWGKYGTVTCVED